MQVPIEKLKYGINKARRRILARNFIQTLILIIPIALVLSTIFIIVQQFASHKYNPSTLYFPTILGLLLFIVYKTTKGINQIEVALKIDRRAGLADRISSALEFSRVDKPTPFMFAAMTNAVRHAENVDYQAAFPIWPKGIRSSLIAAVLIAPLFALVLFVDFGEKYMPDHTALDRDLPVDNIPSDAPDAPDLAKIEVPPRLAPLVEPVKNYIKAWKTNLAKMRKELARREKELAAEVPRAIFADSGKSGGSEATGIKGLKTAITDNRIHISDLKTMGVYDGSEFSDVFAALDETAFDEEPSIEDVEALAQMMTSAADRKASSGATLGLASSMNVQNGMDGDDVTGFQGATQGAMQESFNEFLRNYGAHLSNVARTKTQLVEEAKSSGKVTKTAMSSAPPPPNAKLKMMKLTDNDHRKVHLSPVAFQENEEKLGAGGLGKGGGKSAAGRGGGTAEGSIKVAKVESSSENLVEMDGVMGEGKSAVKILEDLDSLNMEDFSGADYRQLYVDYTQNASMILDSEQIPIEIKSYIRDYFISITPDKVGTGSGTGKGK